MVTSGKSFSTSTTVTSGTAAGSKGRLPARQHRHLQSRIYLPQTGCLLLFLKRLQLAGKPRCCHNPAGIDANVGKKFLPNLDHKFPRRSKTSQTACPQRGNLTGLFFIFTFRDDRYHRHLNIAKRVTIAANHSAYTNRASYKRENHDTSGATGEKYYRPGGKEPVVARTGPSGIHHQMPVLADLFVVMRRVVNYT